MPETALYIDSGTSHMEFIEKFVFNLSDKLQSAMIMYEKMTMNISINRHYINLCGITYNLVQHTCLSSTLGHPHMKKQ